MFVSIPVDGQVVAWGTFYESWKASVYAILRTKCNLTGNGVSRRILMELSQSHYFLSQLHIQQLLQVQATLPAVSVFFLAQPSCLPTSCLLRYPLKDKNCSAYSIACFAWSEMSQYLGKPWFILCATGHFLFNLSAGRKVSTDLGEFCLSWRVSSLCMPEGIPALCQWGAV